MGQYEGEDEQKDRADGATRTVRKWLLCENDRCTAILHLPTSCFLRSLMRWGHLACRGSRI